MKKSLRVFAAACIVLAGAAAVFLVYDLNIDNTYAADRDFIAYWAAGQLLVHGQSPYDFQSVRALEVAAGQDPTIPIIMMRNPPDAFFMAYPLGFCSPKTGLIAWMFVMVGALLLVTYMVWRLNGSPDSRIHLLGFAFGPCLLCLRSGQCGILLLLGIALFLYLVKGWPFLAGAALVLCAVKPHLFLPFGAVLLVWSVIKARSLRVPAGFCVAMAANCGLAYWLDPHAWSQYSAMMRAGGALNEPIPVLSVVLRSLISPGAVWIQFVPVASACVWAVWYFWRCRAEWDWMDQGLVVLLVGAVCTPFGWITDEAAVLPAVLTGIYRARAARRSIWPIALFAGAVLVELLMNVPMKGHLYLWTTPAWLCWYLYATGRFGKRSVAPTG